MLLVLLMTMATASLSASFAIFLVRERANKSKHVQVGHNFMRLHAELWDFSQCNPVCMFVVPKCVASGIVASLPCPNMPQPLSVHYLALPLGGQQFSIVLQPF